MFSCARRRIIAEGFSPMNEAVGKIWEAVGAERDEAAHGFFELSESSAFGDEAFLREIDGLRRFVGAGFAIGGRRPSPEFFEVLLSRGRVGAEAMLNAYLLEEISDARERAVPLWRAVSAIARTARAKGFVGWDLNDWKPLVPDDSKARLVAYVGADTNEKVRRAAFEGRLTVSAYVEAALIERIEKHEKKHGPLAPREPVTA